MTEASVQRALLQDVPEGAEVVVDDDPVETQSLWRVVFQPVPPAGTRRSAATPTVLELVDPNDAVGLGTRRWEAYYGMTVYVVTGSDWNRRSSADRLVLIDGAA